MKLHRHLCAATFLAAALTFLAPGAKAPGAGAERAAVFPATPATRSALAVRCSRPPTLRLIRFEDGSAQLRCGRRILVRVSVPH